jgi:hypothetical protein
MNIWRQLTLLISTAPKYTHKQTDGDWRDPVR